MTVLHIRVTYWQTITDYCLVNHFTYTSIDGKKNKVNIFNIFVEERFDRVKKNCLPQIRL